LLGYIISQAGIIIDLEIIKAIDQLPLPHKQKDYAVVLQENQFCEEIHPQFWGNYQTPTKNYS
jgi:hypothetical protein